MPSPTQVYFRWDISNREEFNICENYFPTTDTRTNLEKTGSVVICRYSALPYNGELCCDLYTLGLRPINNNFEHSYIANMEWVNDLGSLTFTTWDNLVAVPDSAYPIVIKGRTNSRKFEWNTRMFAEDRKQAVGIMTELLNDPLIGPQGLVYRQYVPLKTYEIGINGMPMTNEWRCFFYKHQMIDAGFYWSIIDELETADIAPRLPIEAELLACQAANIVAKRTNFFVVDVAQGVDGKWWVVEINDGQMSGLSTIDPDCFYHNLRHFVGEL